MVLLPIRRGLLTPLTVAAIIGRDEHHILKLIDGGELEFAFDIRGYGQARCLRIATLSVADYCGGCKGSRRGLEEVLRAVLPGQSRAVPRTQVAREFSCSTDHAAHLFPARARRGPTSPMIPRAEVMAFLQNRRVV